MDGVASQPIRILSINGESGGCVVRDVADSRIAWHAHANLPFNLLIPQTSLMFEGSRR